METRRTVREKREMKRSFSINLNCPEDSKGEGGEEG
jgi:hypothetical protein